MWKRRSSAPGEWPPSTPATVCFQAAECCPCASTWPSVFRGWADTDLPDVAKTEVTVSAAALDWTTADVVAAARTFVSYLGTTSHGGRAG